MKIIFSPTKSQSVPFPIPSKEKQVFSEKTMTLVSLLQKKTKEELQKELKLSDALAEKTYQQYQNFYEQELIEAIRLFSGTSFKELHLDKYSAVDFEYMNNHLCILSALYGVLCPQDMVHPYRLDMTEKNITQDVLGKNLYEYWYEDIENYFQDEDYIINLASREYLDMLPESLSEKIISIHFSEELKKISSMELKKQRGRFLDYMISNRLSDPISLQAYVSDSFVFDKENSDKHNYFFKRVV